MTRRSFNEVQTAATKALQARGLPHGVAEELAAIACVLYREGQDGLAELLDCSNEALLALADAPPATRSDSTAIGCDVPPESWARAEALMQKTYVPATDASRAGAGANINDSE